MLLEPASPTDAPRTGFAYGGTVAPPDPACKIAFSRRESSGGAGPAAEFCSFPSPAWPRAGFDSENVLRESAGMPTSRHPALESIDAINARDLDAVRALHSNDMVLIEMPFGDEGLRGPDGKTTSSARYRNAMPNDLRNEVHRTIEEDDWVAIEGVVSGTHEGPLALPEATIQATGEKIVLPYCTLAQARDGQVVSVRHYYDTFAMRQLGDRSRT